MIKEREEALFGVQMGKERLISLMLMTKAYKEADSPKFCLAAGRMSKYYVDCKAALSFPEFRIAVGSAIFEMIRDEDIHAVGGPAVGAYPIAIAVSDAAYKEGQEMTAFVVRKEAKEHGLRKHVEGHVESGSRVLIVDDVITTGNSTLLAIEKSSEAALTVVRVIALIDREEADGKSNIERKGFRFDSLLTFKELQSDKNRVAA